MDHKIGWPINFKGSIPFIGANFKKDIKLNNIERLESNVDYFVNILEKKIKNELQSISDVHGLIIDIGDEKEIEIHQNGIQIINGPVYDDIWSLMEIWWENIKFSRFYGLTFEPKE